MGYLPIVPRIGDEIHSCLPSQVDEAIAVLQAHRVKECSKD